MFDEVQLKEKLDESSHKFPAIDLETQIGFLRYAIRLGRLDVVKLLLNRGAKPTVIDKIGIIIEESFHDTPGHFLIFSAVLESLSSEALSHLGNNRVLSLKMRFSMKHFVHQGLRNPLAIPKLESIELAQLHVLRYKVVGQTFAVEQIISEIASYSTNKLLTKKPLVLLFSGPPGHGKTETALQLAQLLSTPFHKVDCRNHAHPWEMFGSGTCATNNDIATNYHLRSTI